MSHSRGGGGYRGDNRFDRGDNRFDRDSNREFRRPFDREREGDLRDRDNREPNSNRYSSISDSRPTHLRFTNAKRNEKDGPSKDDSTEKPKSVSSKKSKEDPFGGAKPVDIEQTIQPISIKKTKLKNEEGNEKVSSKPKKITKKKKADNEEKE